MQFEASESGNILVEMVREDLENIPQFDLPDGYALHWYQPGDEEHWVCIQRQADQFNAITSALFNQQFGTDFKLLEQRQCYLLNPRKEFIGTATAWFDDNFEEAPIGRVHWVALLPDFHGRGLSKPLMTAVCRRLRELGHRRVYLRTSSARVAAIALYLRFGFVRTA